MSGLQASAEDVTCLLFAAQFWYGCSCKILAVLSSTRPEARNATFVQRSAARSREVDVHGRHSPGVESQSQAPRMKSFPSLFEL